MYFIIKKKLKNFINHTHIKKSPINLSSFLNYRYNKIRLSKNL